MSSPFQKSFCGKSPLKQMRVGEIRRKERRQRRDDRRDRKRLEKGQPLPYEGNLPWFQ